MGVAILSLSLQMYHSVQRAHSAAQILLKGVSKQAAKERKGGTQDKSRPAEGGGDYDKREHPHTCRLAHPRAFGMDGLELSGLTMTAWRWAAEYADRLVSDFHLACARQYTAYTRPRLHWENAMLAQADESRISNLESRLLLLANPRSCLLHPRTRVQGLCERFGPPAPYSTRRVLCVDSACVRAYVRTCEYNGCLAHSR